MNYRKTTPRKLLVSAASVLIIGASPLRADQSRCALVRGVLADVSSVRGLPAMGEVACSVGSRQEVERFLKELISKKLPPQKLEHEGILYRAVGIVPDDYRYETEVIELYLSQIGGYYDPEKKQYVIADWMPETLQGVIARHELTHALQDQRYDLTKLLEYTNDNGDELLAHSSLIEGDATAVTTDIQLKSAGQPPLRSQGSIKRIVHEQASGVAAGASSIKAPAGLQALMLFPYTHGLSFVHALLRRGGYAEIDRAFQSPPQSSREILHPTIYISNKGAPQNPSIDELRAECNGQRLQYYDTIGEFGIDIVLRGGRVKQTAQSRKGSEGWVGDRIALFNVDEGELNIVWITRWERDIDAQEFSKTLQAVTRERYGATPTSVRTPVSSTKSMSVHTHGSRSIVRYWIVPKTSAT